MRLLTFGIVLAVVCGLLAPASVGGPAGARKAYVVGAIFSTTGDNAPLGVPERATAEMLEKQINAAGGVNGHPIRVEIYDDAGKPELSVEACQRLLANKDVVAIIGPTLTGPSLAITRMCQKARMPLISCAASIKIVSPVQPYVFKTAQTDSLAVAKLIDYLKRTEIKSVGFLNDSNAFGASGREQWLKLSRGAGIRTVDVESFGTSDTDMTSQLTKIRGANPQAVICWGTNPGPAIVARNMRTLRMKQPLLMSHGIANMDFIKLAGPAADGVVFPAGKLVVGASIPASDPQRHVLLKFAADYQRAYGKPANSFGGYAQDSLMLVVNALRKVGPDHARIRDTIEKTRRYVGISGVFNMSPMDHNGLTKDAFALVVIVNGRWKLVK